ncbi:transcriptional regulator [Pyrolobus fumarii 1A]|uniref:Transcriptional regulator n=1 Tax=Pyrolobus fumarii (strain DSM 11204 / 1A) TaxID=694429 RepID=G0EGN2_PYRF1|nr:hypothetical protein [Pyrolobus fumarii]AEM38406.1 transcriptional regulator [Pyrolobus fumarii 1A]
MARLSPVEWVVLLVGLAGGRLRGGTVLQKLGFLGVVEAGGCCLGYTPTRYGPVSAELARGVDEARRRGLVRVHTEPSHGGAYTVYVFELTGEGRRLYEEIVERLRREEPHFLEQMERLVRLWADKPFELLRYVYSAYPEYAISATTSP